MNVRFLAVTGLLLSGFICDASNLSFPQGYIPFSSIYYVSGTDANGYSLVEGIPPNSGFGSGGLYQYLQSLPSVSTAEAYSDQAIELAPGQFFSNVLIPTDEERAGNFQDSGSPILDPFSSVTGDPSTASPFVANIIPASRLFDVFAFRVGPATSTPEPGALLLVALALCLLAGVRFRAIS